MWYYHYTLEKCAQFGKCTVKDVEFVHRVMCMEPESQSYATLYNGTIRLTYCCACVLPDSDGYLHGLTHPTCSSDYDKEDAGHLPYKPS